MTDDRYGENWFERESSYSKSILKGKKPLYHRFWVRYLRRHKGKGKLLDIGCGKGFFLEYAERFFEAYGVDVSTYAVEKAAQRLRSPKLCIQDATRLGFKSGYFDVVTYFDILEHLEEPELAVKECSRVLKEGGIVVISVPNIRSYGLGWKKSKWHGYREASHVSLLSNEEWIELLETNNFKVVDKFYDGLWDSPYFPLVPAFIQHLFFKIAFTVLFPLLGTLDIKLPRKWGEGVIFIAHLAMKLNKTSSGFLSF